MPLTIDDVVGVFAPPLIKSGPFEGLRKNHYSVILADPPWGFKVWDDETGSDRSASKHYPTMRLDDIKALPVADLAARDCVLLLWVTDPFFPAGLDLLRAWGFVYKTVGYHWVKETRDGRPAMGNGYWTRANPELCLLAVRGRPKRVAKDVRRLISEPAREHSRKPDCVYERTERLLRGPYVELFGRTRRPGWTTWGNDVGRFVSLPERAERVI